MVALADDFLLQPAETFGIAELMGAEIEVELAGDLDAHAFFAVGIAAAEPQHALSHQVGVGIAAKIAHAGKTGIRKQGAGSRRLGQGIDASLRQ